MSVNDLPRTESYNLVENRPSLFKKLPLKKLLISLLVLIGLVTAIAVFLRTLDSRSRSASQGTTVKPAGQTPGVSAQAGENKSDKATAGSSFNPFASLLQTPQKETSEPAETVPSPAPFDFSDADLKKAIEASLKLTDLEISEKSVGDVSGCKMNGSYLGREKGGNYYGRNENTYADGQAAVKCQSLSLLETFSETFWIKTEIYNRQYKDKSFSKLAAGSNEAKAQKVPDYLQFYFSDTGKIKMISSTISGDNIKVTAALSRADLTGQFVFTLSKSANKILGFSFDLTSKIEGAAVTAAVTGSVSLTVPSAAINVPSFQ